MGQAKSEKLGEKMKVSTIQQINLSDVEKRELEKLIANGDQYDVIDYVEQLCLQAYCQGLDAANDH